MEGFLGGGYLWVKAAHVISVIFWMAGMFMLPRYFAYHVECERGSDEELRWQERERKLLRIIVNPAMIASWVLGLMLAFRIGWASGGWLHLKIVLLLLLSGLHGLYARWRKDLASGRTVRTSRFYRMANEIPALFVIAIVLLAVVKPF